MADREKVIKALTECIFLHENPDDDAGCLECPYRPDEKGTCPTMIPFLKDVLELLKDDETQLIYRDEIINAYEKDQEPVKPKKPLTADDPFWLCGNCGKEIESTMFRYCPYCGRKVEWDEGQ